MPFRCRGLRCLQPLMLNLSFHYAQMQIFKFSLSLLLSSFAFLALFFLFRWAFTRLYLVLKRSLEVILARVIKL